LSAGWSGAAAAATASVWARDVVPEGRQAGGSVQSAQAACSRGRSHDLRVPTLGGAQARGRAPA